MFQIRELKKQQGESLINLCKEQLQTLMEVQQKQLPMLYDTLESLVSTSLTSQLKKLDDIHDREVNELKKKLDAANREEMKQLAKKHKDKNELARWDAVLGPQIIMLFSDHHIITESICYRGEIWSQLPFCSLLWFCYLCYRIKREAMQKHIQMAVHEREKVQWTLYALAVDLESKVALKTLESKLSHPLQIWTGDTCDRSCTLNTFQLRDIVLKRKAEVEERHSQLRQEVGGERQKVPLHARSWHHLLLLQYFV